MTVTLLSIAGTAFVVGIMVKGLLLDNVNYLGVDNWVISIPFVITLITSLLIFTVLSEYPISILLNFAKALYFTVFFCIGLAFYNLVQRSRGLI